MTSSLPPFTGDRTFSSENPANLFQLCVSLIETMRSHSRLLNELGQLRELRRRGLVYRERIHPGRQFVEAYLLDKERKIVETIKQLEATRRKAYVLIERASGLDEACESTTRTRFTSRLRQRQYSIVTAVESGRGQLRASL